MTRKKRRSQSRTWESRTCVCDYRGEFYVSFLTGPSGLIITGPYPTLADADDWADRLRPLIDESIKQGKPLPHMAAVSNDARQYIIAGITEALERIAQGEGVIEEIEDKPPETSH